MLLLLDYISTRLLDYISSTNAVHLWFYCSHKCSEAAVRTLLMLVVHGALLFSNLLSPSKKNLYISKLAKPSLTQILGLITATAAMEHQPHKCRLSQVTKCNSVLSPESSFASSVEFCLQIVLNYERLIL